MIYIIGAGLNGLCTSYYLSKMTRQPVKVIECRKSYSMEASYINGCQNYYSKILPLATLSQKNIGSYNFLPFLESYSLLWKEPKWFFKALKSIFYQKRDNKLCSLLQPMARYCFEDIVSDNMDNMDNMDKIDKVGPIVENGINMWGNYASNPMKFSKLVYHKCIERGVDFSFNTELKSVQFSKEENKIINIETDPPLEKPFDPDKDVIIFCTGIYTRRFLDVPLLGFYGFSVINSNNNKPNNNKPNQINIIDSMQYITVGGEDRIVSGVVISDKLNASPEIYERLYIDAPGEKYCYARPMSPNGLPIIERYKNCMNVFVNTGQGFVGYTMAALSGYLCACLVIRCMGYYSMESGDSVDSGGVNIATRAA